MINKSTSHGVTRSPDTRECGRTGKPSLTVTSKLLENLPSGRAKQTRGNWAGSRGGGTGSAGPDQRNQNNPRVWSQQNARGRARRRAPRSQQPQRPRAPAGGRRPSGTSVPGPPANGESPRPPSGNALRGQRRPEGPDKRPARPGFQLPKLIVPPRSPGGHSPE